MACPEILHVHAYVDGETDAPESARIERHLQQCESCRALYEELEHMRTAIHQDVKVERAPRALHFDVLMDRGAHVFKLLVQCAAALALLQVSLDARRFRRVGLAVDVG